MKQLRVIGRGPSAAGHRPTGQSGTPAPPSAAVTFVAWYVNRDGVPVRSGPGPGFTSIGQLFYLDRGIKLREADGWIQLRLRYRSASGLRAGATAWLPTTCVSPCTPPVSDASAIGEPSINAHRPAPGRKN